LARLPDEMREIILLRDYHDLSYAEIARVLSVPTGTVMSRLHRARCALRERMRANG
jgi:RNA polymerase sigma-70 factor (ECF subfamily)